MWVNERYHIVKDILRAKFTQNPELRDFLLSTNDYILVEAAPRDKVWGVGLSVNSPSIQDRGKWKGANLLGKALMEVRDSI